jgi:hypothetical protein
LSRPDVGDQARALGWVADPERVAIGYRTSTGQAYVECTGDRQEVALVHHGGRWVFTAMPDGPLAQGKWEAAPSVGQIELRESDGPWIPDRGEFALNLLLHAAELVGVMREAFVRTTDYAKQREQFGRPLASFQVVQHKLVDMVAELHALEALLEHAVDCLVMEEAQDIDLWTHAAAGLISEAGPRMLGECLHLHGAIGMTREFWVHVWMRRAVRLAGFGGSSKQHLHDVGVRVRAGSSLAVTLRQ